MAKTVFVSYSHRQSEWVWDRLVPCLRAGGAEVLIDGEQFEAARAVNRQMDEVQDRADLNVLVFSPDYLASKPCRREMRRAIQRDPRFENGDTIPVQRLDCTLPPAIRRPDPLYVDLRDDRKAEPWDMLLKRCAADLGTSAPHWLEVREDIRRFLGRGVSVNLIVQGHPRWKELIADLRLSGSGPTTLGVVDLLDPETYSRKGLAQAILSACGVTAVLPDKPNDLVELGRHLRNRKTAARVALIHFDHVQDRSDYEVDLFSALRFSMTESRKLVLLIQSRKDFQTFLPNGHPLSSPITQLQTVELKGRP